jgi:hypothetical protein
MKDYVAINAIEQAKREILIARAQLKIVRALAKVKPHLRRAVLEIAADWASRSEPEPRP